jgi:hypothetical protein
MMSFEPNSIFPGFPQTREEIGNWFEAAVAASVPRRERSTDDRTLEILLNRASIPNNRSPNPLHSYLCSVFLYNVMGREGGGG